MPDSRSKDPGFESILLHVQSSGIFVLSTMPQFTLLLLLLTRAAVNAAWSLNCINEHLANAVGMQVNSLCAVMASRLNAFHKSRVGAGRNMFATGVKCEAL